MTFCTYITFISNEKIKKYYYGKAKVKNILKGYKGSGVCLKKAFKNHPKVEWTTVILTRHETEMEAYEMEAILVNQNTLNDSRCLNLMLGGWGQQCNYKHSDDNKKKISEASKLMWLHNREKITNAISKSKTLESRQKASESSKIAGQDEALRNIRSINAKRMIARPEHLSAFINARYDPEIKLRSGKGKSRANDKRRQERFPPEVVREIFNTDEVQRILAVNFNCSRTIIKKIKNKDPLFDYAWI